MGIGLAVLNLSFGTEVSGALIYHFGAEGRATTTGSHSTGNLYNDHNVRGYDVLIKKADGTRRGSWVRRRGFQPLSIAQ